MPSGRTILLVKLLERSGDDAEGEGGIAAAPVLNTVPIGTFREIIELVAQCNTAPDGAPLTPGVLHGPGIVAQLPLVGPDDPVTQILVSVHDEAVAWPVLLRMCSAFRWTMLDPSTGRTFGGS